MDKQNWKLSNKVLNGSHMPVKPMRRPKCPGSFPGKGRMKFTKAEIKAARKALNKERYGL
jgi:hypothetical protein